MISLFGKRMLLSKMFYRRGIGHISSLYDENNNIKLHMNELRWDLIEIIDDRYQTLKREIERSNKRIVELETTLKMIQTNKLNESNELDKSEK